MNLKCFALRLKVKHILRVKVKSETIRISEIRFIVKTFFLEAFRSRRRHRLKGIHSRSDTSRTGADYLFFYYPRLLHCLDQMLAVVLLSQHRVSSSKTVRPRAPCGARCIGHAVSTVHGLRFAQRRHTRNSVKERDPICGWTKGIAQHQCAGG